jgi:hypothetical protein
MPRFLLSGLKRSPPKRAGIRIEQGLRSQSGSWAQALHRNHVLRLFHIYVMPCCRGKRILALGLWV